MKLFSLFIGVLFVFAGPFVSAEEMELGELAYLRNCYSLQANPFGYEMCVNSNFSQINREYDTYLSNCYNLENNPFGYELCMNQNFNRIERVIEGLFLNSCYSLEANPFGYELCVNQNFGRISRASLEN